VSGPARCACRGRGLTGLAERMTRSEKTRVLYLGAGAPHAAVNGMDVVCRSHVDELLDAAYLDVTGLVVAPAPDGRHDREARASIADIAIIMGDPVAGVPRARLVLRKLIYAVTGAGAMIAFSFRSAEAKSFIGGALRTQDYDIVVIDHFATLANVPIQCLRASRIPIVYIAHDVMPVQIRDTGRLEGRWLASFLFNVEAMKASFYERMLLKRSRAVIFLSSYDRDHYGPLAAHAEAMLPARTRTEQSAVKRTTSRTLLFVGSPRFRPNGFAIKWLVDEFAPLLYRNDPSVRILLAGSGTERVDAGAENVTGLGFVPDTELCHLMDAAVGVLCPIVHGSGIKIKALDAIARGCLVFATEEALRGLDEFEIRPLLDIKDPAGSADRVVRLASDPDYASDQRLRLSARYDAYCRKRHGRLARIMQRLHLATETARSTPVAAR
jgi:glycosyltransferase involved in cell wall biosynthesis